MANVVVSAIATFNGKALKKGKKEISSFEKQVKSFAKVFAAAFSGRALINYSRNAVKAFAADEKAAKSLEVQLRNTGFAFSAPGVEQYIARLQGLYGVLDDELRPAFQQLLTATGSITKSQDALQTALNVSAATGRSLSEVSAALTRGFSGNTTGLSRLGAGISKATLKTGDMDKIMTELNANFSGQATARLGTFAGKMSLISVASADATEIIGKGLIDALTALGDDNSIDTLTNSMTDLATGIADVTRGIGELAAGIKTVANLPGLKQLLKFSYEMSAVGLLQRLGRMSAPAAVLPANQQRSAGRIDAKRFQTENKLAKAKAAELALLLKKNAADKNVEELKKKFDIERIGLTVALNAAVDEETKLRIRAQLAILDNNDALAKKILEEMKAAEAAKALADAANKAATALGTFDPARFRMGENKDLGNDTAQLLAALAAMAGLSAGMLPKGLTGGTTKAAETLSYGQSYSDISQGTLGGSVFDPSFVRRGESQDLKITVDVSQTGDRFAALIAESLQIAQKSGISYGIAGGL